MRKTAPKVPLREELLRTMEDTGLDEPTVRRLLRENTHSDIRSRFKKCATSNT